MPPPTLSRQNVPDTAASCGSSDDTTKTLYYPSAIHTKALHVYVTSYLSLPTLSLIAKINDRLQSERASPFWNCIRPI